MYHKFVYVKNDEYHEVTSEMVNIGEDQTYTSMSNTVGLPVAVCAKLILQGKIKLTGVHIPILPEIYNPILDELEAFNIVFKEKDISPPRLYTEDYTWS